jgi:6-phosphogluconolactonase (cycloisomerase 2 family)
MSVRDIIQAAAGAGGAPPPPPANAWDLAFASFQGINRGPFLGNYESSSSDVKFNNDGTRMYVLGTTTDAVLQYNLGTAYQPSTAVFPSKSVAAEETSPGGVEFKPDGTKMYVIGNSGDDVNQYDLSTAWDVTTASYVQNFSVSAQAGGLPRKVRFKDDGTKMYVSSDNDAVYQYSLSSAWDISTASYDSVSFSTASQSTPYGLFFGDSGSKMYIVSAITDTVYQYTLSTPWDLSTASYANLSFSVVTQENAPQSVIFKSDGTIMYVIGSGGDDVNQYALSSAWDVSTASFTKSSSPSMNTWYGEQNPSDIYIKPDGTQLYVVGPNNTDSVWQQTMPTAWDVANMVPGFYVGSQEVTPQGLAFKDDGTKMYIVGSGNDTVYQYSLSTAWNVLTASYDSVSFSVASQEDNPRGITFKTDGTKMYIIGIQGDDVNEYNLSTAWNVSTASYIQNFSVLTQTGTTPVKVEFKSDGTKMFVASDTNDAVYEYALSSAWDISTASYSSISYAVGALTGEVSLQGLAFADSGTKMYIVGRGISRVMGFLLSSAWNLSNVNLYYRYVGDQESVPRSVPFKPDGTEMYVLGTSGDDVNQYSVSTAWSVQSASYVRAFVVSGQTGTTPVNVNFKDDGTKMYVLSNTNDAIYQYSLSTAWDVSTASYDSISFSVNSQESNPTGMFIGDSGTKLYVVGNTNNRVYQYTLSSAWDLSTASYANKSFSVSSQEPTVQGVFVGDSGAKMYIVGTSNDTLYQYTLSTPWDVSTASYTNINFNVAPYEGTPLGFWFKNDGTSFYVTGTESDIVWQFTIS